MANKKYKVILLGKIAEGYDIDITHENLANVFDIDLKKIPKLLKKPTVIRKNLTETDASRYKHGLEKIGVLCQITNKDAESTSQPQKISVKDEKTKEPLALVANNTLLLNNDTLRVINVKISFGSMVTLFVKLTFASIPALMILGGIGYLIQQLVTNSDSVLELITTSF